MDRFRDLPDYERVRERLRDADALKDEFWAAAGWQQPAGTNRGALAALEREIEDEAMLRFPGGAVSRVRLLQYGDDPEVEPGDLWVLVIPAADGPEDWGRALESFCGTDEAAIDQFVSYLPEKLCHIRILEFTFDVPVSREATAPG